MKVRNGLLMASFVAEDGASLLRRVVSSRPEFSSVPVRLSINLDRVEATATWLEDSLARGRRDRRQRRPRLPKLLHPTQQHRLHPVPYDSPERIPQGAAHLRPLLVTHEHQVPCLDEASLVIPAA